MLDQSHFLESPLQAICPADHLLEADAVDDIDPSQDHVVDRLHDRQEFLSWHTLHEFVVVDEPDGGKRLL